MLGKLNRYLARVSIFLITAILIAGMAGCVDGGDYNPPPSKNLEIWDWYDMDDVRENLAGNHTLMNDLDSTTHGYEELASSTANGGKGWQPIGFFDTHGPIAYIGFMGTFDGQGHEIRDLYINRPDEGCVALFGKLDGGWDAGGVIKSLGVVNVAVTGDYCVGGLAGGSSGTVINSHSSGNITSRSRVGGLVGCSSGTVSNSYSTSIVVGEWDVGGLVGDNEGTVDNSYYSGSVAGNSSVGGLVGENFGTVSNSYSTGSVTGNHNIGSLVGSNVDGTVNNSYATGNVNGDEYVGGLVGDNMVSTVSNSHYNYDEVLINGENIITVGALFNEDFDEWLAEGRFLDVNGRLSQENGYYVVNNVKDFKQLLAFGQDATLKFRLTNDLDLSAEPNFYVPYFAGEFDGNGHIISDLTLNYDLASLLGLFGYLAPGGKVTQLGLENINVNGYSAVGGLVGHTWEGTVSESYASGSVTGNDAVGGLVGHSNFGIVNNSHYSGSVRATHGVGGLVGGNAGPISNCYSTGDVAGEDNVGGLVGFHSQGTVGNSYSSSSVTAGIHAGGLVGVNFGLGIVSNSYCTGSVAGDQYIGGLVGSNGDRGNVSNSYSTGSVTGNEYVGGLVGHNYFGTGEGTVSNCFWDTQTSGQATSDGGMGKSTAEMKNIATFSGSGWKITGVANLSTRNPAYTWNIVDDVTYPFLSWQPV
jgi:hypothetical protein